MGAIIWNQDPVLFKLGPLSVHWYGVFFAAGLIMGFEIMKRISISENRDPSMLETLFIYIVIGVVAGARLAHCFIYEPAYYIDHPLEILAVWQGGLASHGGIVGAVISVWLFSKKSNISFAWLFSRLLIPSLLLASLIRIGNFFNSEILGKATEGNWGIVFLRVDGVIRHPVMLYESAGYFLLLILIIGLYLRLSPGQFTRFVPGIAITGIFTIRIVMEEFKMRQAVYAENLPFSVGQMLSFPFLALGIFLLFYGIWQNSQR